MQKVVSFKEMANGTKEDFTFLEELEDGFNTGLPDRLLETVKALQNSFSGYQISRYEHSLQSATRAYRNGEDDDMIVGGLLHDIGDELAPHTHGEMVAAIVKPFLSKKVTWIIKMHPVFQQYYMGYLPEANRNARDHFKDHPYYDECVKFCEHYDQNCFDPDYEYLPIEFFEPMVRRVFSREPQFD